MKNKKNLARGRYMEEDLTKLRHKMYYIIRKSNMTTKCWTIEGKIFAIVKGTTANDDKKHMFNNPDDLFKLGWNADMVNKFIETDDLSQFIENK